MKNLIEKLTSYNLFNYLLPGTVFSVLAERFTSYSFIQNDLFIAFFAYYFTGLVISRIGSIILEPCLRKLHSVTFAPYSDFVRCAAKDEKLDVLSETNNTFRTLATVFAVLGLIKPIELLLVHFSAAPWLPPLFLCIFLFVLFILAYRKQTEYIKQRIEIHKEKL
jgi:hypothetical protein